MCSAAQRTLQDALCEQPGREVRAEGVHCGDCGEGAGEGELREAFQ